MTFFYCRETRGSYDPHFFLKIFSPALSYPRDYVTESFFQLVVVLLMWDVEENAYRQTKSKEEYHDKLKEGFSYIISRIGKSRAQDLKEEMGIV